MRIDVLRAAIQKWLPRPPEKDVSSPLPAPIDITVLKGLVDNDQEMAREILAEYLARAKQNAQELRDEIASEDLPGIAAQAHKLKSSYRIIGADALHEVCTEIETLARSGNLRDIQDAAVRFDDMHTRVQAHITRLLASPEL